MFDIKFTPQGQKDLKNLPKDIQRRVIKKIKYFSGQPNPIVFSKPLVNIPPSTHRFRVGKYRIAFYVSSRTICIDRIRHRKGVYY